MGRWASSFRPNSSNDQPDKCPRCGVPPRAPIRASVDAASAGSPPGAAQPPGRLPAPGPGRSRAPPRCLDAEFARFARSVKLAGTGPPALPRRGCPRLAAASSSRSPPPLAATLRTSLSGRSAPPCALRAPVGGTPTCRASGLKPSRARFARRSSATPLGHANACWRPPWRSAGASS